VAGQVRAAEAESPLIAKVTLASLKRPSLSVVLTVPVEDMPAIGVATVELDSIIPAGSVPSAAPRRRRRCCGRCDPGQVVGIGLALRAGGRRAGDEYVKMRY
jgi:hypothetical protein